MSSTSAPPSTFRARFGRLWPIVLAFAVIILGFLAADVVTSARLRAAARPLGDLSGNAAPSMTHLGQMLAGLGAIGRDAHAAADGQRPAAQQLVADVERMHREARAYRELPVYPGETEAWTEAQATLDALDRDLSTMLVQLEAGDRAAARATYEGPVLAGIAQAGEHLSADIALNAENGARSAESADVANTRTRALGYGLDFANAAVALTLAALVVRANRRAAEADERRARELEAFAGRMAHDVRSPLSAAVLALDRVGRHAELPPSLGASVERGRNSLTRTVSLVEALLDFARAGGRPEPGASADVGAALEATAEEMEPLARAAGVTVSLDREEPLGAVACAPGVLGSVVSNLTRNAIKHMGDTPERRVALRARRHGRCVRVEVVDTGPGVPPELRDAIFEPYVRASRAEGIGLGLATVKRLVEAHGGAVGVRSAVGGGATFWFELPVAAAPPDAVGVGAAHRLPGVAAR